MQVGHNLHFECIQCHEPITFSVLKPHPAQETLECSKCKKKYAFGGTTILRHLSKFEALCRQICDSQEILGDTSVSVKIGHEEVSIPYKILLTRLSPVLELVIEGQKIKIAFRLEPSSEIPKLEKVSSLS